MFFSDFVFLKKRVMAAPPMENKDRLGQTRTGKDDGRRAWFGTTTPQPKHVVRNNTTLANRSLLLLFTPFKRKLR
jgi:hypothetical protein